MTRKIVKIPKLSRKPKTKHYEFTGILLLQAKKDALWLMAEEHDVCLADVIRLAVDEFLERHYVDKTNG